jgi:hypothetical protein
MALIAPGSQSQARRAWRTISLAKTDNLFKKLPNGAQYATIGLKPL